MFIPLSLLWRVTEYIQLLSTKHMFLVMQIMHIDYECNACINMKTSFIKQVFLVHELYMFINLLVNTISAYYTAFIKAPPDGFVFPQKPQLVGALFIFLLIFKTSSILHGINSSTLPY